MSAQQQFYLDRAEQARQEAQSATLDNVRDRCLRSEAAWSEMAARVGRTEKMRVKSEAAKAAAREEEAPGW